MADDSLLIRGAATIRNYAKGADEKIARRRLVPAMLKAKGRIPKRQGGDGFSWQWEFRQATANANNGAQSITPAPVDRYRQSTLTYKGYEVNDKLSWREKILNRDNKSKLIDVMANLGEKLIRDMGDAFHTTFYADGTGTSAMDGMGGFLAYTQTIQEGASTPTARTANAADRLGYPNDTYAGHSTVLGNLGGTWSGDYCGGGTGSSDFDAYTPTLVRCQSTAFGGSTWQANAVEAVRYGAMQCLLKQAQGDGMLDTAIFPSNMWYLLANRLDAKERVTVRDAFGLPHYGQDSEKGVIVIDGLRCTYEYGVPVNRGYGINWGSVEYRCCLDSLIELDDDSPKWVGTESGYHWIARMLGNYAFTSPRDFVYWDNNY